MLIRLVELKANSPIKKIKDKLEISNLLSSRLENNINNVISNNYRFFKELQLKLTNRMERNYEINHNKFKILTSNLNTLSPLATIERGFSITMDQKKSVIKDINQINVKDKIYTRLKDATITSSVEKISKN
jgi:exodeoxyribonuclease VII large subunit